MTRHELYQQFGVKLIEALALVIKDEINTLRSQHGLANRTNAQIVNSISDKLDTITDYNWMEEE